MLYVAKHIAHTCQRHRLEGRWQSLYTHTCTHTSTSQPLARADQPGLVQSITGSSAGNVTRTLHNVETTATELEDASTCQDRTSI